jgi:signal transduction histidine kinase
MIDESLIIAPDAEEITESIKWLIRLRWAASAGVFLGACLLNFFIPDTVLLRHFLLIALTIFLLNCVFSVLNRRSVPFARRQGFIFLQIICDWTMLLIVIHLSGGITSPGIMLFVFHLLIAGFLFSRKVSYMLALLAGALLVSHAMLVKKGLIHNFSNPLSEDYLSFSYEEFLVLAIFIVFVFGITANFASVIAGRLRLKEQQQRQALQSKLRFARMTHHQLRAPLAAVQSSLDAIPYSGELNIKQKELLGRAAVRIKDAFTTIRDLLDLARAENASEEETGLRTNFQEAVKKAVGTARERAAGKKIEIKFRVPEQPIYVRPGVDDIDRIVSNLLDNAVKYTAIGGQVEFRARLKEKDLLVSVKDSGIGIAPEDHAKVFEGFYRTKEAKATEETGTGLGLSIVRQLVNHWGGRVSLKSELNVGSTFKIELPLAGK